MILSHKSDELDEIVNELLVARQIGGIAILMRLKRGKMVRIIAGKGLKCISCSVTPQTPYIVPADDKKTTRLIILRILLDTFKSLKMSYPEADAKRQQELLMIRNSLAK